MTPAATAGVPAAVGELTTWTERTERTEQTRMERTERRERHYGRRQRSWGRPGGPAASSPQAACPTRGAQDQARESLTPRDHRRTFLPRKWKAYGFLDKATHMSATVGSISISNTDQSATARHSRGVNADLANPIHSIHAHAHAHVRLRRCIHIPPSPLLNPRPSGYLRRTVSYPPRVHAVIIRLRRQSPPPQNTM